MSEAPKPYIITIVGPESSGKTTLARQLSQFLGCPWVPEYAREYLSGLDRPYEEADLSRIAQGQFESIASFFNTALPYCSIDRLAATLGEFSGIDQEKSFLTFAKTDFGLEPRKILIVDNGLMSVKMWAQIKYGAVKPALEHVIHKDATDMFLLCRPVYPWAADPMREAPALLDRAWIYNQFLLELATMQQ